jgi:gliding motility-associated-like protein
MNILIEVPRPGMTYKVQYAVENLPLQIEARKFGKTYLWAPARSLNDPNVVDPVFTGITEQFYTIQIRTAAGCLTTDSLLVRTVKNADIIVPSAFTPNNDGKNDILKPTLMGMKELRYFRVFNRWGELMYETKRENEGWNGKVKGAPMSTGTIIWIAEGVGVDNKVYTRKGTAVLIK